MVCFSAFQTVAIQAPLLAVPIQRYFGEPERLVKALVDPHQVCVLGEGSFRLTMRSINFMMLTLQPVADIMVWNEANRVLIQSERCRLMGQEALNSRLSFNLEGFLEPRTRAQTIELVGQAALQVQVDLPAAFRLTPRSLLESTGNGVLSAILLKIKQQLLRRLVEDYAGWAAAQEPLAAIQARAEQGR
jgi:hypothetical protein